MVFPQLLIIAMMLSRRLHLKTEPIAGNRLLIIPKTCSIFTLVLERAALKSISLWFRTISSLIGTTRTGLHWKPESPNNHML